MKDVLFSFDLVSKYDKQISLMLQFIDNKYWGLWGLPKSPKIFGHLNYLL